MNKPIKENFVTNAECFIEKGGKKRVIAYDIDYQEYANALNKYCEQLEKALENVISDCDAIGVDWFDSIADIDESSPLLEDCVDRHGWLEGIKQYYLKKVSEDE